MIAGAPLLVLAAGALGATAFRVAARWSPDGLERAVAATPLAVAAAVAQALGLGLAGLGGSPLALTAAAIATWAVVHLRVPAAQPSASRQLHGWLRRSPWAALAVGAWAGLVAWALRSPFLGLDGGTYHLAAAVAWAQHGTPGSSEALYALVPIGSYPLTGEVALAWGIGIANGFAPVAAWTAGVVALLLGAGWLGLRRAGAPRLPAALALAALLLAPLVMRGAVQADTDVPALAFLAAAAALVAAAGRGRPGLLVPAVVAAGLAIGIKTTTAPLALLVLAIGAWRGRAALRGLALPLAAAVLAALATGGVWYVRNLILHGSPLWPFRAAPWGDPVPPLLARLDTSLLERPRATLAGQLDLYRAVLGGGVLLLAASVVSPAWAPRRGQVAAAVVTLVTLLAWAAAPFTGAGAAPFLQLNTLRYAIPALAVAAAAVALSARSGRRAYAIATLVLAAAALWSLTSYLDTPYLPDEATLAGATAAATVALLIAVRLPVPARALSAALAVGLAVVLALGSARYTERRTAAGDFDAPIVGWFGAQPQWRDGTAPIAFSPTPIATLAGNELRHPLRLIAPDEPCDRVRARLREGWVVVRETDRRVFGALAAERCLAGVTPRLTAGIHRVYGGP